MSLTSFALVVLLRSVAPLASAPQASAPGLALRYDLVLGPGERLLDYRWDRGATVPFQGGGASVRIEHGERGLGPGTRVYLPASGLSEAAATGATVLEQQGLGLVGSGRYASALALGRSSYLRLALPPSVPSGEGWTLSFWVRPEAAAFGTVLALLPGAAEVRLRADGRVETQLLPAGERLTSVRSLAAGAWAFVAVAYDPRFVRQARLVVEGELAALRVADPAPLREPAELLLGDLARDGSGPECALDDLCLESYALSTDQLRRARAPLVAPGTHLLELRTSLGLRTAHPTAAITSDLDLDVAAELELGALRGVVLAGGVLRWAPGRWRDLAPRRAPPPRTTHPLVALGGGRVLTFGGETRDTEYGRMFNTDDAWILDAGAATWERVTGPAPAPRCHVPMAYSPDHDLALLVRGWQNESTPGTVLDDTWVLHVGARRWERRWPSGDAVGAGSDHGLVYLPALRKFLLLQGQRNLLYDPAADRWQSLPLARAVDESGAPATYRVGASTMCALDPSTGEVVLFGGSSGPSQSVFSDTTALYDVGTNTYTVLAPSMRPAGRVRSGFAHDPQRGWFVLFGGARDQYAPRYDDLWVFTPRTREWHELACSGRPSPRGGYYGMAYDEVGDRFLLYGGRNAPERWLDETLALELDAARPGSAVYTFDRGAVPTRNAWFADVDEPADSGVTFLFRGSDSGAQWSGWSGTTAANAGRRYLQAVAFLKPGTHGEVPSIRRMGLR